MPLLAYASKSGSSSSTGHPKACPVEVAIAILSRMFRHDFWNRAIAILPMAVDGAVVATNIVGPWIAHVSNDMSTIRQSLLPALSRVQVRMLTAG